MIYGTWIVKNNIPCTCQITRYIVPAVRQINASHCEGRQTGSPRYHLATSKSTCCTVPRVSIATVDFAMVVKHRCEMHAIGTPQFYCNTNERRRERERLSQGEGERERVRPLMSVPVYSYRVILARNGDRNRLRIYPAAIRAVPRVMY